MFNAGEEVYIIDAKDKTKFYPDLYRIVEELPESELLLFNLSTGEQKTVSRFTVVTKYIKGTGDKEADEKIKKAIEEYTATAKLNEENRIRLQAIADDHKALVLGLAQGLKAMVENIAEIVEYTQQLEAKLNEQKEPPEETINA